MRFEEKNICKECRQYSSHCKDGQACSLVRKKLRNYDGIRLTSDGFDCALPVSIDSHTLCSYGCLYCFSDNLIEHREQSTRAIGQTSLQRLENIFSGEAQSKKAQIIRKALKYDNKNKNGYPCPIQLGAICDPLDNIERNQGWFLKFVELVKRYKQPVRISTKGILFLEEDYINCIKDCPELFWVAFSIISPDDDMLRQLDKRAPLPSERLKMMKKLSDIGVKTSLRFRPILPGVSDRTTKHKHAYKDLVNMAVDAGAKAISYEVGFLPGRMPVEIKARWNEIEKIIKKPLKKIYKKFGKNQACMRPGYAWTENIMHSIYEIAKRNKMAVGVSDPTWKQLSDYGCCCGISPDDPVFGNWEKENATMAIVNARDVGKEITFQDICPPWAKETPKDMLCAYGAGAQQFIKRKTETWEDNLRELWNDLKKERSPLNYFQGAIIPIGKDKNNDIVYKYIGLKRKNKKNIPYWNT